MLSGRIFGMGWSCEKEGSTQKRIETTEFLKDGADTGVESARGFDAGIGGDKSARFMKDAVEQAYRALIHER